MVSGQGFTTGMVFFFFTVTMKKDCLTYDFYVWTVAFMLRKIT